jgi:hypothetical protein
MFIRRIPTPLLVLLAGVAVVGIVVGGMAFAANRDRARIALTADNLARYGWQKTAVKTGSDALQPVVKAVTDYEKVLSDRAVELIHASSLSRAYEAELTLWSHIRVDGVVLYTDMSGDVVLAYVYTGDNEAFYGTLNTDMRWLLLMLDGIRGSDAFAAGQQVAGNGKGGTFAGYIG